MTLSYTQRTIFNWSNDEIQINTDRIKVFKFNVGGRLATFSELRQQNIHYKIYQLFLSY